VDVTISQLAWKLQTDPEKTVEANARYLRASALTALPTLVTVDLRHFGGVAPVAALVAPDASS
jgi:predicted rRNA methylase YqxC with S4 and FtsJ domains